MKVYIAGPMTNKFLLNRPRFYLEHLKLKLKGYKVMNPAVLPLGFSNDQYMTIAIAMLQACDRVYLLKGWEKSKGANLEVTYAKMRNKEIIEI